MTETEKRLWRIQAALEELCHIKPEEVEKHKDLQTFLKIATHAIYICQTKGPSAVKENVTSMPNNVVPLKKD